MPGIAQSLKSMQGRLPLYAFSNTNGAHVAHFTPRFQAVLKHFERVFVSSAIGRRKPEAAAFEYVVGEIGVPAGEILFFDDLAENIEAAKRVGLQGVHVKTATCVADALFQL